MVPKSHSREWYPPSLGSMQTDTRSDHLTLFLLLMCLHKSSRSLLLNSLSLRSLVSFRVAAIKSLWTIISAYLLIGEVKWVYLSKASPTNKKGSNDKQSKQSTASPWQFRNNGNFITSKVTGYHNDETLPQNKSQLRSTVHLTLLE